MFTLDQIKTAHDKVNSGADFPAFIREIKGLGVTGFETWVVDSHTDYFGADGYRTSSPAMYDTLNIASTNNRQQFEVYLKLHQQGQTDYAAFCRHCAETGVEKWKASLTNMTCTYYDKAGNSLLEEVIPG